MIYQVLPGDAQAVEFAEANINGEVIVFREALITGPIDAETPDEFWNQRARFILAEYAEDEIEYHEKVADEILRLGDIEPGDEVNLWFEFELFCSVNYWFSLYQIKDSGAKIFRVAPVNAKPDEIWNGFAGYTADGLRDCFESRTALTAGDVETGAGLWSAYSNGDPAALKKLGEYRSPAFPFLAEVTEAASVLETRPSEIVAEIIAEGKTTIDEILSEFRTRAGVFGFGDLQVEKLVERIK